MHIILIYRHARHFHYSTYIRRSTIRKRRLASESHNFNVIVWVVSSAHLLLHIFQFYGSTQTILTAVWLGSLLC
ncbi:unnamed protein product [Caenorhabditis nigoni]